MGYQNLDRLHERLAPMMVRRTKHEVMPQLPKRLYKELYIEATPAQKRAIKAMLGEARRSYGRESTQNTLAKLTLALMGCDSTELLALSESPLTAQISGAEGAKIEELKEVISQTPGKVLIFTQWKRMANILNREVGAFQITGDTKDKMEAIETFKNSDDKVLVATDCLNYGANLQFISTLVHFDLPWSPARIEQREGRIDRIGQENNILVVKLLIKDSPEEKVVSLLADKQEMFTTLIEGGNSVAEKGFLKAVFAK